MIKLYSFKKAIVKGLEFTIYTSIKKIMTKSIDNMYKVYTFVLTVHTTLPLRTASQGVSFAL